MLTRHTAFLQLLTPGKHFANAIVFNQLCEVGVTVLPVGQMWTTMFKMSEVGPVSHS